MRGINGQRDGGAGAESKVRTEPGSNLKIRAHSGGTFPPVSDVQLRSSVKRYQSSFHSASVEDRNQIRSLWVNSVSVEQSC